MPPSSDSINIAMVGCGHGQLDQIYASIGEVERRESIRIDLCIITGDVQAARNQHDLLSMAVPPKYLEMGSFHRYYSGEEVAPVMTIFIGGNHEASALSVELWPGGWAAPNIYYMGSAAVVQFAGLRIAGLSGIYKQYDYRSGYYEQFPLDSHHRHSICHVRQYDVCRLAQLSGPVDLFLSHDWPTSITDHGDVERLLRRKPFFRQDIESGRLGHPHLMPLMSHLQPEYWFAAHLHVKFPAVVQHAGTAARQTKFLALDKCLPNRPFLQVVSVRSRRPSPLVLHHDPEWLAIVKAAAPYLSLSKTPTSIPEFRVDQHDIDAFAAMDLVIHPDEFDRTAPLYDGGVRTATPPLPLRNAQVARYYSRLGIADPMLDKKQGAPAVPDPNPDEIEVDF